MLALLLPILVPFVGGCLLWLFKGFDNRKTRNIYVGTVLIISAAVTLTVVYTCEGTLTLWSIAEGVKLTLRIDGITKFFASLMCLVFTTVGFYAFDYMHHEENEKRFFAFYLMVMGVLSGIYLSANLVTMYLFYELMTLTSLPLVLHSLTKEAIAAGKKYLFYSVGGAFLSLVAIFYIYSVCGASDFVAGGYLGASGADKNMMLIFVFMAIIGFGCKAGLFPLQDWLPTAHPVAPSPASAVLSGIITKSGVIVLVRLIFYSVGADYIRDTWVQYAWMTLALITVFLGSMRAYHEKVLKKRLAYSSVSQVSYVLFGLSLLNATGFMGALLHVAFHSIIKDGLFLIAGAIIIHTGAKNVDELRGIGKKMPVTIWCFTLLSLALIGIPPASGFVSKWFLCLGALESAGGAFRYVGPAVLLISALLTAGYLLPITIKGFFPGNDFDYKGCVKCEPGLKMTVPIVIFTAAAIGFGLAPGFIENAIEIISGGLF